MRRAKDNRQKNGQTHTDRVPDVESKEEKEMWDSFEEDVLVTDTVKTVHEESDEEHDDYDSGSWEKAVKGEED